MIDCENCIHVEMCKWCDEMVKNHTCDWYDECGAFEKPKHGEWIYDVFDENYHCSECNRVSATINHFCPNCGSDNRKSGESE